MGERADEITPFEEERRVSNLDTYAVVPGSRGAEPETDSTSDPEAIRANIDHTRNEMSQTLNAIQEKFQPQQFLEQAKTTVLETASQVIEQAKESVAETASNVINQAKESVAETASQVIDQAKESVSQTVDQVKDSAKEVATETIDHTKQTVHDATVGKVEHMVSNITDTAQETGSGIMHTIQKNPIPAALVGLGLGWLFLKGQNQSKPTSNGSRNQDYRQYPADDYGYRGQSGMMSGGASYNGPQGYYPPTNTSSNSADNSGLAGRMVDTVRENPVPAALAGLGIGYMVMQGQGSSSKQSSRYADYSYPNQYGQPGVGQKTGNLVGQVGNKLGDVAQQAGDTVGTVTHKAGDLIGSAGEKVGDVAGSVGQTVGDVAGSVGQTVGDVAGGVGGAIGGVATGVAGGVGEVIGGVGNVAGNVVSGVGDTIGGVATGVGYQAQRAENQFERMLEEKPLAVGVIALALGVTVGLLLPGTSQENRLLGEAHETLMEKAQETVQQTFDKVQHVTEEVGHSAGRAVEDLTSTAKKEAHEQGLTK